jgi:hypothetical protein
MSNVSLAFYEAALKPLNIKFFLPYKGEGDHPDLWGFGDGKRAFFIPSCHVCLAIDHQIKSPNQLHRKTGSASMAFELT